MPDAYENVTPVLPEHLPDDSPFGSLVSDFQNSLVDSMEQYQKMYRQSVEDPEGFWGRIAENFSWKVKPNGQFFSYNFDASKGPIEIKWMENAKTNICYNALDRNVQNGLSQKIAFYWEGNDIEQSFAVTYGELCTDVCKFSSVLRNKGVKKGDRITIYMPMIVELVIAMLACARIGAVHNVVFGGFSSDSLTGRILDCGSTLLITADGVWRGTKLIHLKEIADDAVKQCSEKHLKVKSIVVRHLTEPQKHSRGDYFDQRSAKRHELDFEVPWNSDNDSWWHEEMSLANATPEVEWVESEHPLFILYTSGSTGKPKGVIHSTAGYMLYTATTFQYSFCHQSADVYFCTADIGWITGHSYGVYGPLLQGATSVIFEGIPTHPDPGRYWAVIEKFKVTKFYTAPTAIRSLMKYPDSFVTKYDLKSLEVLGTVGEPINPEAWQWYYKVVGNGRCTVVDTYWQSETGGHVITPLPRCTPLKPGSATCPFFGVVPAILNDLGKEIEGPGEGHLLYVWSLHLSSILCPLSFTTSNLCIGISVTLPSSVFKKPWPGMMRSLYGSHDRFAATYFTKFPGYYCSGDGARRDSDDYYWITGRTDDMLNVSGHLLSTAEVESALVGHTAVAESAAVARPHAVKGECLYCYIVLKQGYTSSKELIFELKDKVRSKIGSFATPEYVHFAPALPKTRSGKVLRRVLRKIAVNDRDLGDLTTLAEDSIIKELFDSRPMAVA